MFALVPVFVAYKQDPVDRRPPREQLLQSTSQLSLSMSGQLFVPLMFIVKCSSVSDLSNL